MSSGVIVAFDYGMARTGVARTDYNRTIAIPVKVLYTKDGCIIKQVLDYLRIVQPVLVIVGWPISIKHHENEQCIRTQQFIDRLSDSWRSKTIKVDERFSTVLGEYRYGQHADDSHAAACLLESFIIDI